MLKPAEIEALFVKHAARIQQLRLELGAYLKGQSSSKPRDILAAAYGDMGISSDTWCQMANYQFAKTEDSRKC